MSTCTISPNPSIPAENATCAAPGNQWTETAHAVGAAFARQGLGRAERIGRQAVPGQVWAVMKDLERRGLLSCQRGGWWRITQRGLELFPLNRCARWRQAFDMLWIDLDAQRARVCGPLPRTDLAREPSLGSCDVRPTTWQLMFAHDRECWFQPKRAERPTRRVPEQIVRSVFTTNVAEFNDPKRETHVRIPSLEDVLRRAPADDFARGDVDLFPATRIGYPTGPRIERTYT